MKMLHLGTLMTENQFRCEHHDFSKQTTGEKRIAPFQSQLQNITAVQLAKRNE